MRSTAIVIFSILMVSGVALEQTTPNPAVDLLGAHSVSGRGCLSCHTPRRSTYSGTVLPDFGNTSLDDAASASWGPSTIPLYGKTIVFGDHGRYVQVSPKDISTHSREVDGILVCLSCHDGNLTPPSMMVGQSFEQRIGLVPGPRNGGAAIPTLPGADSGSYANDHPVGSSAVIPTGEGLVWINDGFAVAPGSPYSNFVANYGRPSLVPGSRNNPWGVNSQGQPFVLCTTCHNQHAMSVYVSSPESQIASDGGGKAYPTVFFVNGPYDPTSKVAANPSATSATQFCRQCHFSESNEANNSYTVPTIWQNY